MKKGQLDDAYTYAYKCLESEEVSIGFKLELQSSVLRLQNDVFLSVAD